MKLFVINKKTKNSYDTIEIEKYAIYLFKRKFIQTNE